MKSSYLPIIFLVILASCGVKFDSAKPWENPPQFNTLTSEDDIKLASLINPFAPNHALNSYYVDEIVLKDENNNSFSLHKDEFGQVFVHHYKGRLLPPTREGDGHWRIKKSRKGSFLFLDAHNGESIRVQAGDEGRFIVNGKEYVRSLRAVDELNGINRFCILNMKSAGRVLRDIEELNDSDRANRKEEIQLCEDNAKEFMDVSKDPQNDKNVCRSIAKKYRSSLRDCK